MNPSNLVTSQLLEFCTPFNSIVICGYTKTGKITIAKKISNSLNRLLLISDKYLENYGYENALEQLIKDVVYYDSNNIPFIVEGILCFRLLRKCAQLNIFHPKVIIKTECNEATISYFYHKDGEGHKLKRALSFNKGLDKIWDDYRKILQNNPTIFYPKYISLNTSL